MFTKSIEKKIINRKLAFSIVLALFALISITLFYLHEKQKTSIASIDSKKLSSLTQLGTCSSGLPVLEKYRPNKNSAQQSIDLLSYRSYCYTTQEKYQLARSEDEQLLTYLNQTKDITKIDAVKQHLVLLDQLQKTPQGTFRNEPISKRLHDKIQNAGKE